MSNPSNPTVKNGFQIPKWAGKPPSGLHLDVMKEGKMIQKLMIDEKNGYFFGRNNETCDFVIDHQSCSRVHAVLLWHKHLNRSFLIDLNSTHGTFIGSIRLDSNKPQQVFVDSELKFGASTRTYIIRERPQVNKNFPSSIINTSLNDSKEGDDSLNMSNMALPESEAELDNLTEFNTAHNKRISQLVDITSSKNIPTGVKRKKKIVSFCEEEDVINPEDVDPSIGKFRNMIQTTIVIPNKKKRSNPVGYQLQGEPVDYGKRLKLKEEDTHEKHANQAVEPEEEEEVDDERETEYDNDEFEPSFGMSNSIAANLGITVLDLAPNVDSQISSSVSTSEHLMHKYQQQTNKHQHQQQQQQQHQSQSPDLSKKKIYAKEAWPGRKSQTHQETPVLHTNPVSGLSNEPISSPTKTTTTIPTTSTSNLSTVSSNTTASSVPTQKRLII